jgi:lipopolysaccharide transport system permease protein
MIELSRNTMQLSEEKPQFSIRLQAKQGWVSLRLKELWNYREFLYFLVWRDIKVRYKQTALGAAWAVLQPLCMMLVFSLFFGRLAKVPSDGLPYPLFVYAALVPWTLFANGLSQCANSLVGNGHLLTKVYFPRLAIPIAAVSSQILDFILAFIFLLGMMIYYGIDLKIQAFWLPCIMLLSLGAALGTGLWFSALNVRYRDVRYVLPFVIQFWMFATPVFYPSSLLTERWRMIYGLNPMAGAVEGLRWALFGGKADLGPMILVSFLTAASLLVAGAYYFRRMEKTFADMV